MNRQAYNTVGVVGVGYAGSLHAEKYAASRRAELVAVADVNEDRAAEVASRFSTGWVADYRELLGKVRCLSICVPTYLHHEITRAALVAGLDVLVEKPLTSTLEDARDLVALAREKALILQVGHLERFNPIVRRLEKVLTDPRFIECHRLAPFVERGTDVNVVLDLMIHDIDVISSLVPSPVNSIDATGVAVLTETPDIANARIRFANGCVANVTSSRVSMKRERKIRVFQNDAYVSLDYDARRAQIYRMQDRSQGWLGIRGETVSAAEGDALKDEIESFLESVETRRPPVVSGEDGVKALEIAARITAQL